MARLILKLTICGLSLIAVISCSSKKEDPDNNTHAIPVKVQEITEQTGNYNQEYIGTVEGENAVDISFQSAGNIEQVYFQEGQSVQKGQLLARLNTISLQSMYNASSSTLAQARDAYDRLTILYNDNSLPEIKYIEVKTALEQAQAAEQIAKKNLSDANLYAPFSGVISKRYLDAGTNVAPGTPIYNMVTISTIKVKVAIPEREISTVKTGQRCLIKISALNNKSFEGTIIEKGISAHPISHTYDVKVKIENRDRNIMPGMVCKAYLFDFKTENVASVITIPMKSVQLDGNGGSFVWLKSHEDKAIVQKVVLGGLTGNDIVINEGLQPGDQLIIEGYQHISPGSTVSVSK